MGSNDSHWHTSSDRRIKKDIVNYDAGLNIINQVQIRNFKYKQYSDGNPITSDDAIDLSDFPKAEKIGHVLTQQGVTDLQLGVIAQELETVLPDCVKEDSRGVKTVVTDALIWHMVNAIKELSAKVSALEAA